MAGERTLNFGADETDARYQISDTGDGANFVLARDLDGGTVLLEYDDSRTPSEWVVRGPVDLDGNDLSAGAIDATSVTTENLDVGAQNLTEHLLLSYPVWRLATASGGGSAALPGSETGLHIIKLREPGGESSQSESRVFDSTTKWDPTEFGRIRINVGDIAIDNNTNARIVLKVSDDPDNTVYAADDSLEGEIRGDGDVVARTRDDGVAGNTIDSTQDNAFVGGLECIEIRWDGSTLTVEASDGSASVAVSDGSNHASGESLFLSVHAADTDGSNGQNIDVNISGIETGD